MADGQETKIRFIVSLDDQGQAPEEPAPRTQAPEYAARREQHDDTGTGGHHVNVHPADTTTGQYLRQRAKDSSRHWRLLGRAGKGFLRGAAFAQQGGMASSGVAAMEFGQGVGSLLSLAGGSTVGSAIAALAGPIAAIAAGAGAFAVAVKASSDALEGMAERAKSFSGQVAISMAERDVQRIFFEMEQAQRYGRIEAEGVAARGKFEREWDRIMDKWKASFSEVTTPLIDKMAEWLSDFNKWMGLKGQEQQLSLDLVNGMETLQRAIRDFKEFSQEDDANPAGQWMANTPHFELKDIGMQNAPMWEEAALDFKPFKGALAT